MTTKMLNSQPEPPEAVQIALMAQACDRHPGIVLTSRGFTPDDVSGGWLYWYDTPDGSTRAVQERGRE